MSYRDKRRTAIWGGLLAGVGLGSLLAWLLDIFEIAHPMLPPISPRYPSMALTAFVMLVFCGMFGAGLGLVASALIRDEDARPAGAAAADPEEAENSTGAKSAARRIFGPVRGH